MSEARRLTSDLLTVGRHACYPTTGADSAAAALQPKPAGAFALRAQSSDEPPQGPEGEQKSFNDSQK